MSSVQCAVELAERMSHRGLVALRPEDVLHATVGSDYAVRAVFSDPQTDQIYLAVVHPDLPAVAAGAQSPILNVEAHYGLRLRVLPAEDDPERTEVWQRPVITIGPQPSAQAPVEVMSPLWLETSETPALDTLLALLRAAADRPDAPHLAADFLDWLIRANGDDR